MPPPPPPPPLPGAGGGPPPPPPPGGPSLTQGFKIVPGLGDALHEMKRRISGVEETPACAEGTASDQNRATSTPTGPSRPKSWHGSQVPGKPPRNNAMLSEMQSKLQKRKEKVDKEAYVVQTPENALPPTGQSIKPTSSTPLRGWTPPVDYGPRRASRDSGRDSWTPTSDYDPERRVSVDFSQYRKVSVDLERKEELSLAKAVRKSSVKMLGRGSPSTFEQNPEETVIQPPPPHTHIPPPSPVVMRYWKQCSSTDVTIDSDKSNDEDKNGQSDEPAWKTEALEGDITEFPSIKNKIANMEEEAKPKMFVVPDVKSKMRQTTPTAGWMETRSKLQNQLDTLISKTSAKITKFGDVNAVEKKSFVKESSSESEKSNDTKLEKEESPKPNKLVINSNIKSLIKSVANEIQRSFSAKNISAMDEGEDGVINDENNNEDAKVEEEKSDKGEYWRNLTAAIRSHPQNIDMEAPIDFDYKEEDIEEVKQNVEEEQLDENTILEDPVDFDSVPMVLDASAARSKAKLMRKRSTERRLPASVLAKKKAAEKLKDILTSKIEAGSGSDESNVIEQIQKELIDASFQVDMSNPECDLENLNDDEKADLIAKQISKMDSSYVMKLLKKIEKGILDISIPMLMPFLSLQVKLKMGTNIFKGLEPHNKKKMVKENFINDMIEDITDIALLQEVIDRTQEKLNILNPPKPVEKEIVHEKMKDYFNIENDSFELPSVPMRQVSVTEEEDPSPVRTITSIKEESPEKEPNTNKNMSDDISKAQMKEASPEVCHSSKEKIDEEENNERNDSDVKKSDDEGCPSSEFDSSSEEDKEEAKDFKDTKKSDKEKVEEDEGIGKEQESKKTESNEGKEKNIKQSILKIIENAKSIDQKRAVRNYGRTFEFQNVQLKPTVPNDRRPAKAKRMDNMWTQTLAKKQGVQINHLPTTPKPKVPWTMKKNAQPEKKVDDKDVDEFEKCRDTLKNSTANATSVVSKNIKNSQKMTGVANKEKRKDSILEEDLDKMEEIKSTNKDTIKEDVGVKKTEELKRGYESCKEKVTNEKLSPQKVEEDLNTANNTEETIEEDMEYSNNSQITSFSDEKIRAVDSVSLNESSVKKEEDINEEHINKDQLDLNENSRAKVTKEEADKIKESISKAEDLIKKKIAEKANVVEKLEVPPANKFRASSSKTSPKNLSRSQSPVESRGGSQEDQIVAKSEQKDSFNDEEKNKDEVPSTPIVRRRGDTFTVVLPPPRGKPPPPPMSRPPPPPMSPPVPVSKVKDLEMENKLIIGTNNKSESESESEEEEEEESEWEWTEEEESESECEVKKEGWENILSSSKGPTTFKAEYSVKI